MHAYCFEKDSLMRLLFTKTLCHWTLDTVLVRLSALLIETIVNLPSPLLGKHFRKSGISLEKSFFPIALYIDIYMYYAWKWTMLVQFSERRFQKGGSHLYDFFQSHGMRILFWYRRIQNTPIYKRIVYTLSHLFTTIYTSRKASYENLIV